MRWSVQRESEGAVASPNLALGSVVCSPLTLNLGRLEDCTCELCRVVYQMIPVYDEGICMDCVDRFLVFLYLFVRGGIE